MSFQASQESPAASTPADETKPNPFSRPSSPQLERHDKIAFIGLGNMGREMALNLAIHLHAEGKPPLVVWNRSKARLDEFVDRAAQGKDGKTAPVNVAKSLRDIGEKCDFVFTSMGSDAAVEEVYAELFAGQEGQVDAGDGIKPQGRGRSTVYIDTSTISPKIAGKMENIAAEKRSRHFLSCPVFGEPPAAAKADLVFAISGEYHAKKHAAHLLIPALGRKVLDLGSNVERAAAFKLVGNTTLLAIIELLAESMTLADATGVGADNLYKLIQELYPVPAFLTYGRKMLKNDFRSESGFQLSGGIQDASHIRDLASQHNVPVPIIDLAHQHMVTARATALAQDPSGVERDWSSLVSGVRIAAGQPAFKAGKPKFERYE